MDPTRYADAASDAWGALERAAFGTKWFRFAVREGPDTRTTVSLWTLTHVIAAASDLRELDRGVDLDRLLGLVPRFRADEGYLPTPTSRLRFYDDNAWLGLLSLRLAVRTGDREHRRRAARIVRFLRRGIHPDGGIRWKEGHESRNACSTAPTSELLVALGAPDDLELARTLAAWIDETLLRGDGTIADRIEGTEQEPTAWSYHQGAAIGLHRRLADATGDATHRGRAIRLAHASLDAFGPERSWTEPPPFLVIWFRELLALPDVAAEAGERLRAHCDRMLDEGRDAATGLFTAGGLGSYDGRSTIDQA
ncbi:MAG TPA: glycoside hydrolase family 76 protein, partial [Actinomycetota bacterium]|nr:glycoside hydrolase family 76 protein [Actinomycetota bacterium]